MTEPALAVAPKAPRLSLMAMLRARYQFPEWVVEGEITLINRRIDVLAFNQWATRGYQLVGFEFKESRADWLRELRSFEKNEHAFQCCDVFYLVSPKGVTEPGEVPGGWGHLEARGSRLVTKVHPRPTKSPADMPRELAARLLSRSRRAEHEADFDAQRKIADRVRTEVTQRLTERHDATMKQTATELRDARAQLDELNKLLGLSRHEYRSHELALRAAGLFAKYERDGGRIREELQRASTQFLAHADAVRATLAALPRHTEAT